MTTRMVTNDSDYLPGDKYFTQAAYDGSLRGVLAASQSGDTIAIRFPNYIYLVHPLVITKDVTIDGTVTALIGNPYNILPELHIVRQPGHTVLETLHANVTLENLILTQKPYPNGSGPFSDPIGGLDIEGGTVVLDTVTVTSVQTERDPMYAPPSEAVGGILMAGGADVTIRNSTIDGTHVDTGGSGGPGFDAAGGILVDGSTLHLIGSTIKNSTAFAGEGGGNEYGSNKGGNGAGGILIRGGGAATIDGSSFTYNYGAGGAGAAGFDVIGGGEVGGVGGIGAGAILVEDGSLAMTGTTVQKNGGLGGAGGRGGSPVDQGPTLPGIGGSGGGAGGFGVGGVFVAGGAYGSSFADTITFNTGKGGNGGYGGTGGSGIPPVTYAHSPGGGGGAGGIGSHTGTDVTSTTGYDAGTPGQNGHSGPTARGGMGGLLGQLGEAGGGPGYPDTIYSGGGGGGGGGGGLSASNVSGALVACFARGTLIGTPSGEVAIETLQPGDLVSTATGAHRPICWIGHRSYAGRFLAANPNAQPIRFQAGSLGGGLPRRDLLVSPEHAMFLDGLLIPARALVDGTAIVRTRVARVDYFHLELGSHDVLLAEGAPSESFVDDGSRALFHNASEWEAMYPGRPRLPAVFCAPRAEDGFAVEAVRRHLARFAAAA